MAFSATCHGLSHMPKWSRYRYTCQNDVQRDRHDVVACLRNLGQQSERTVRPLSTWMAFRTSPCFPDPSRLCVGYYYISVEDSDVAQSRATPQSVVRGSHQVIQAINKNGSEACMCACQTAHMRALTANNMRSQTPRIVYTTTGMAGHVLGDGVSRHDRESPELCDTMRSRKRPPTCATTPSLIRCHCVAMAGSSVVSAHLQQQQDAPRR